MEELLNTSAVRKWIDVMTSEGESALGTEVVEMWLTLGLNENRLVMTTSFGGEGFYITRLLKICIGHTTKQNLGRILEPRATILIELMIWDPQKQSSSLTNEILTISNILTCSLFSHRRPHPPLSPSSFHGSGVLSSGGAFASPHSSSSFSSLSSK